MSAELLTISFHAELTLANEQECVQNGGDRLGEDHRLRRRREQVCSELHSAPSTLVPCKFIADRAVLVSPRPCQHEEIRTGAHVRCKRYNSPLLCLGVLLWDGHIIEEDISIREAALEVFRFETQRNVQKHNRGYSLREDVELACLDLLEQAGEERELVPCLAVRVVAAEPRVAAEHHVVHALLPLNQHARGLEFLVRTEVLKRWREERADFHDVHWVCTLERRSEEWVPPHCFPRAGGDRRGGSRQQG
eukprot:scaffold43724_cov75-Phaeocystis_antarctica.AAC.3